MGIEENNLKEVLSRALHTERQAYKRSALLTAIPVVVGLVFVSFFSYRVIVLKKESLNLSQQIQDKMGALENVTTQLKRKEGDLTDAKEKFDQIQEKIENGRTDEALKIATNAAKTIKRDLPVPPEAPGFIDDNDFKGPAQTKITIEVIPDRSLLESPTRPRTLYKYR